MEVNNKEKVKEDVVEEAAAWVVSNVVLTYSFLLTNA